MKKCVICGNVAAFSIKATSDYYCQGCAEENFDDLNYLEKIEDRPAGLDIDSQQDDEDA